MVDIEPVSFLLKGKKDLVIAEIGVFGGTSTNFMLTNFDIKKYYAIDPFLLYDGYYEGSIIDFFNEHGEDSSYLAYIKKFSNYSNLEVIRDYSHNAVRFIENESLDFCFIDGNHAYDYVKQDIEDWFPKVKEGGILAGDDIMVEDVKRAVFEHFRLLEYDVFKGKRSWFVIKKKMFGLVKREIIALIPARKGSKRLPKKNWKLLAGKPMICWTIEEAIKCEFLDKIVIFTDSLEVMEIIKQYTDPRIILKKKDPNYNRNAYGVVKEALGIEGNPIVIYLQPTSPLRTAEDIFIAYKLYLRTGNGIVPGYWIEYEKSIQLNGGIFIMTLQEILFNKFVMVQNPLVYIFPRGRHVDIDTIGEFEECERLLEERLDGI